VSVVCVCMGVSVVYVSGVCEGVYGACVCVEYVWVCGVYV